MRGNEEGRRVESREPRSSLGNLLRRSFSPNSPHSLGVDYISMNGGPLLIWSWEGYWHREMKKKFLNYNSKKNKFIDINFTKKKRKKVGFARGRSRKESVLDRRLSLGCSSYLLLLLVGLNFFFILLQRRRLFYSKQIHPKIKSFAGLKHFFKNNIVCIDLIVRYCINRN
jgi:hypothetical protein